MQRFSSTDKYIATDGLIEAVNASITLEKPLLIKGEPGTGKTKLAEEIANALITKALESQVDNWEVDNSLDHLVGELARCMTLMSKYLAEEKYEQCELLKKKIKTIEQKLKNL